MDEASVEYKKVLQHGNITGSSDFNSWSLYKCHKLPYKSCLSVLVVNLFKIKSSNTCRHTVQNQLEINWFNQGLKFNENNMKLCLKKKCGLGRWLSEESFMCTRGPWSKSSTPT